MSKANILHVINGWALGGITEAVLGLVEATPEYNHYATGYCWLDTEVRKRFEEAGCKSIIADNEHYPGFSHMLTENKIDVVVKQTGGGDYPKWLLEAMRNGVPVIENLHCPRKSAIPKDLCRFTVGQSKYTASKNTDREVKVIPNICNLPLGKPRKYPDGDRQVVGRLARYEIDKLHHVIYQVARIMHEYNGVLQFLLMGHVFNRPYFEELKKVEMPDYFIVEGDQDDKLQAINRLDICINPTWEAGFEYVIVEAMSQGIPIVTWQDSAGPETAEGAGIVTRKKVFELACAVYTLGISPELYEKYSEAGIEKVRTIYSKENVGALYGDLFSQAILSKEGQ